MLWKLLLNSEYQQTWRLKFQWWHAFHIQVYTIVLYTRLHVRQERPVSGIDWSHTRHETTILWRHKGQVTSQLTDLIKWLIFASNLIEIWVHMNTRNKLSITPRCRRFTHAQWCLMYSSIDVIGSFGGWHALFCITNKRPLRSPQP